MQNGLSRIPGSARPALARGAPGLFWVVADVATIVLVASAVEAFAADPRTGEGWIGGPIHAVVAGGLLIAVAVGLRSSRKVVARRTAVASALLAGLVALALLMQLVDPNGTVADRTLQSLGVLVSLAVVAVKSPA